VVDFFFMMRVLVIFELYCSAANSLVLSAVSLVHWNVGLQGDIDMLIFES
jgi:hypothetical protein